MFFAESLGHLTLETDVYCHLMYFSYYIHILFLLNIKLRERSLSIRTENKISCISYVVLYFVQNEGKNKF